MCEGPANRLRSGKLHLCATKHNVISSKPHMSVLGRDISTCRDRFVELTNVNRDTAPSISRTELSATELKAFSRIARRLSRNSPKSAFLLRNK